MTASVTSGQVRVWQQPDELWRWRWEPDEQEQEPLVSNQAYDSAQEAVGAAQSAYPNLHVGLPPPARRARAAGSGRHRAWLAACGVAALLLAVLRSRRASRPGRS